ncbi:hypothetical protein D3C87_2155480 [compost metagenome]
MSFSPSSPSFFFLGMLAMCLHSRLVQSMKLRPAFERLITIMVVHLGHFVSVG